MIPLILKIKKESHKNIATAQDIIIEEIYSVFNDAVLHGGTAIWRCFNGNRFSEDIDVYIPKNINKLNVLFEKLKKRGFIIEKKKISENSLYSSLKLNRTSVKFEALFKKTKGSLKEYETIESNFITIYTLSPEQLINEKVNAYVNRLKIRDLYDVFFLLRHVKNKKDINLKKLINNFKKPSDESDLKILILEGLVPTSEDMMKYIKSFV
jgi:predicted nucleotidyltransferase component of viral defense system